MQDSQVEGSCYHHREVKFSELFKRFYLLLIIFNVILLGVLLPYFIADLPLWYLLAGLGVLLIYVILTLKTFVIGMVLAYKSYAPKKLRDRCRFEPSCSTYMILAIEKYGLCKGFVKGIKRINRCYLCFCRWIFRY